MGRVGFRAAIASALALTIATAAPLFASERAPSARGAPSGDSARGQQIRQANYSVRQTSDHAARILAMHNAERRRLRVPLPLLLQLCDATSLGRHQLFLGAQLGNALVHRRAQPRLHLLELTHPRTRLPELPLHPRHLGLQPRFYSERVTRARASANECPAAVEQGGRRLRSVGLPREDDEEDEEGLDEPSPRRLKLS